MGTVASLWYKWENTAHLKVVAPIVCPASLLSFWRLQLDETWSRSDAAGYPPPPAPTLSLRKLIQAWWSPGKMLLVQISVGGGNLNRPCCQAFSLFCKGFKVCKGTSETLKWLLIFCSWLLYICVLCFNLEWKKPHPDMSNIVKPNHWRKADV